MTPLEDRCRSLLDEAIALDRDAFVIAIDVDLFRQAAELARALELDLRAWLDHVRWFYVATDLLGLLLPDTWDIEARHLAADCAAHVLQALPAPHPDALAAMAAAHRFADGHLSPSELRQAHLHATAASAAAVQDGRGGGWEAAALRAAAAATQGQVQGALQGASASAAWSAARRASPLRHAHARAYALEQRWQQQRLLSRIAALCG